VTRFADQMNEMGAKADFGAANAALKRHYRAAIAAE